MDSLYHKIDWKLLAKQKLNLVELAPTVTQAQANLFEGLIQFLDHLQDDAECRGYPVVFLVEEDNG